MPKYSVKKSFTILVAVILVLGVVSLLRIQTDLLPSMSPPYLLVMTTYPGASPEQVEADVTQPLADAAGIGKGTVYEYFSSKEEILQGLAITALSRRTHVLRSGLTVAARWSIWRMSWWPACRPPGRSTPA